MFTGIVQARGWVVSLRPQRLGSRLVIDPQGWWPTNPPLALGDSVCVSGVCLTIAQIDPKSLQFDVIAETLAKSTLGELAPSLGSGKEVNLEPSLTPATPIGGHFMQGHVDGVGRIARINASSDQWRITISPPPDLMDYIIPKGSIAVDGVSLTVAAVGRSDFEIALIPTTLERTTLGKARVGDRVNLEADILSKTIVSFMRRHFNSVPGA